MARVENSCQADTSLQGSDHDPMHFVVGDVAGLPEVDGINHLIIPIRLVAIQILGLAAVSCSGDGMYQRERLPFRFATRIFPGRGRQRAEEEQGVGKAIRPE